MTAVLLVCVTLLCSSVSLSSSILCVEENTEYKCSNDCSEMCPTDPLTFCTQECRNGCFCKSGFSRDNGKCVPIKDCNVKCRDHSTYKCVCDDSCDDIKCVQVTCNYRCGCDDGYKRIDDVCQLESLCP